MKTRSGHLFKRKGVYYVQWRVDGKLFMRSTRKRNRKDAEKERARIMAPFVAGDEATVLQNVAARLEGKKAELAQYENEKHPPLLVSQAWAVYEAAPGRTDCSEATMEQYACQFRGFARWAEKRRPKLAMQDVTPELAEEYASHLTASGKSPGTYNKHLNLLQFVFRVLQPKGRITVNPWERIPRKRLAVQSRRELTVDELRKVCENAEGELRLLFALGIYTGLRLGDCATLQWGEVDLHRGIIRRVPSKVARRRNEPVLVPLHPTLRAMLQDIPERSRTDYVLPDFAAAYIRRSDAVTDQVQSHFQACGIQTLKRGTGPDTGKRAVVEVGFHSLRHTFVSLCREANAPLAVVEAIVGHSNPAMTRHYTHVGQAAAGAAIAALPALSFVDGPDITGGTLPAAPEKRRVSVSAERLRALAEGLTAETAEETKKQLLAMLG